MEEAYNKQLDLQGDCEDQVEAQKEDLELQKGQIESLTDALQRCQKSLVSLKRAHSESIMECEETCKGWIHKAETCRAENERLSLDLLDLNRTNRVAGRSTRWRFFLCSILTAAFFVILASAAGARARLG